MLQISKGATRMSFKSLSKVRFATEKGFSQQDMKESAEELGERKKSPKQDKR